MKKLNLTIILCLLAFSASAQLMRGEELEKYAVGQFGENWVDAAQNIGASLVLDKNKSLTYEQVVDCPGQTKEQLYIKLNYWFVSTFNDAKSVIQLNDKEAGIIVAKSFLGGIAAHSGGMNAYVINISPIIKVDIKDNKIRITYTIQFYDVIKSSGGGVMGVIAGSDGTLSNEVWTIENTFPFREKDVYRAKKSSSKALVMTHAYSNVIMDKIVEAVKYGLVGNENDDW